MTELMPCPFCGGKAIVMGRQVSCGCEHCTMTSVRIKGDSLEYSIECWNERAVSTLPDQAAEPVTRKMLDAAKEYLPDYPYPGWADDITGMYQAMREAAPIAQTTGSPVAWIAGDSPFSPIVRDKNAAQHLSNEHSNGDVIPLCVIAAPPANAPVASVPGEIYQIQGHISKTWMDVTKEAYESTPFERRIVHGARDGDKWWDAYEAEHKRVERIEGILIRELGLAKAQAFLTNRDTPSVMQRSVDAWDKYWSGGRVESDAVEFVKAISAQRALLSARGE